MTPAARLQAAIEVLDEVIASARDDGPPADSIVTRYFKHRRYAGSKDRRAVRELVFRAIRRSAERPESGRAAILGMVEDEPALAELRRQVFVKHKPTEVNLEYFVCDPTSTSQGNVLGANRKFNRVERSSRDSDRNSIRLVVVDLYSFSFAEPRFLRGNFQNKQQHQSGR